MTTQDTRKLVPYLIIVLVVVLIGQYFPVPYFISQPGSAIELSPIIQVEGGYEEQGTFMLTTVRMRGANPFYYAWARWNDYMDLISREDLLAHYQDEEDYSRRQLEIMKSSQETAIILAYQLAGQTIHTQNEGALIVSVTEHLPAAQVLSYGDIVTMVNGQRITQSEELIASLRDKKIGDKVTLVYLRDDVEHTHEFVLEGLPQTEEEIEAGVLQRAGLGIVTITKREVIADPPINIETRSIGGPSAGLMFTLEIYNQLVSEDITRGYRIAGTGTVSTEGRVGRIGGIHQKVVAADKANAEYFFAPNEEGQENSNYRRALEAAADIGTDMKIIPVDTVQDALDFLKKLPQRTNQGT